MDCSVDAELTTRAMVPGPAVPGRASGTKDRSRKCGVIFSSSDSRSCWTSVSSGVVAGNSMVKPI